jgi:hypothetical protein
MKQLIRHMISRFRAMFLSPRRLAIEELAKLDKEFDKKYPQWAFPDIGEGETLEETFARMIAVVNNIDPRNVNEEYIRAERQKRESQLV